ncbi:hypothetical protein N7541_008154 [Penicillium brevicompactum]|uniref:Uncharacterized protein n=1 Tax=Penicillium brevicompactum TaxID=5074 RepID=A0A9W9UMJ1_PENBR|nr:hypothetical protein N7541_008154 [Penicillium brevicompactum]
MPNPYKTYEKASEGVGIAGAAAGASGGFPNPMGGVQNAQLAYHTHQYGKIQSQGMKQALVNEDRARQNQREMSTPQAQASSLTYGSNGITKENGYVKDSNGNISYQGKK